MSAVLLGEIGVLMRVLSRLVVVGALVAGLLGVVPTSLTPPAHAEEEWTCKAHPDLSVTGGVSVGSWDHLRFGESLHVRLEGYFVGVGPGGINDCTGLDMSLDWELRVWIRECGDIPLASGRGVAESWLQPHTLFYEGSFEIPEVCPPDSEQNVGAPVNRGNASVGLTTVDADGDEGGRVGYFRIAHGAPNSPFPEGQQIGPQAPTGYQADPISSYTGAFTHAENDLEVPVRAANLDFWRVYNSNVDESSSLGRGWSHAFSDRLEVVPDEEARWINSYGAVTTFGVSWLGMWVDPEMSSAEIADRDGGGYEISTQDQWTLLFDADGVLEAMRNRNGVELTVTRDNEGRVSTVEASSRSLTMTYDGDGLLSKVEARGPSGDVESEVTYAYHDGLLSAASLPGGAEMQYGYDEADRLSTIGNAASTEPQLQTVYGADGRVVSQTDGNGGTATWAWDAAAQTSTMTDARGGQWVDQYDDGWLVRQVDAAGVATEFDWDGDGNLLRIVDGNGGSTGFDFDSSRRMTQRVAGPASERYAYSSGEPEPRMFTDALNRRTSYTYDGNRNLTGVESPMDDADSEFAYDPDTFDLESATTAGEQTSFGYDAATGDATSVTDAGGRVTTVQYDELGRPTSVTPPQGNVDGAAAGWATDYERDAAGRVAAVTTDRGDVVRFTYDAFGRVASETDANGHTTSFSYDNAGNVTAVTPDSASVGATTFTYDATGNVASRTDARGITTTFAYDLAGRTTEVTTGDRTWQFGYDNLGRRSTVTAPSGVTTTLSWDERSLLTEVDFSDATPDVSYEYDAAGRRTSMTDGAGTVTYAYDDLDRPTQIARGDDVWTYQWDAHGRLLERQAPHQEPVTYAYDASGRLTEVTEADEALAMYSYDDAANSVTRTQANGVTTTTTLDQDGFIASVVETDAAGTVLSDTTYDHDANGNPILIDRDGDVRAQRYDELNRLVEVCYAADCEAAADFVRYAYDGTGNLVSETTPAGETTYTYDGFDQLVSSQGPDGPRSYTYDVAGNRTVGPGVTQSVNAAGQVIERTVDGVTTTYAYDGSGLMVSSSSGGVTTEYDYDPVSAQLVGERDGASVIRAYAYGRELLTVQASDQVSFYATDELGSVRTVRGPTGAVEHSYDYDPYGGLRAHDAAAGAPDNPLLFTGGHSADGGQTYRFGFRAYDPVSKSFTTPDQGGSGDAYRYASANPAVFTDQLGLYSIDNFLQDVNRVSGWVANGASFVAVGCTVAAFCAPVAPIAGSIAAVGAGVNVASGSMLAAENCVVTKGSCAATVGMAAIGAFGSRFGAGKLTTAARASRDERGAIGGWGRGGQKLQPSSAAEGYPHTTFRRGSRGQVTHYAEWVANDKSPRGYDLVKRFDGIGGAHFDKVTGDYIPTPHVQGKGWVRPPEPWEVPQ